MAATSQDDADPVYFPSQAWFAAYRDRINENDEYAAAASGWGVDFDGDFVFEMRGLPVDALDTDAMPADLAEELERYVHEEDGEYVGYSLLRLEDGRCTEARLIEDPEAVSAGFRLTADNETWKRLVTGEIGVVDGMMTGRFEIEGDMQKVLQYSEAAVELAETAAAVDAEFADETFGAV